MINKEIYDSDDPASLDLEGLVNQARLLGFTSLEKTEILTVRIESSSDECKLFALYVFWPLCYALAGYALDSVENYPVYAFGSLSVEVIYVIYATL